MLTKKTEKLWVDDEGQARSHHQEIDYDVVVWVSRTHGAWLITVTGLKTDDATPDELYSCASSLKVAKRVAREMAERFDYAGPFHWQQNGLHWELWGHALSEWDTYVDEEIEGEVSL